MRKALALSGTVAALVMTVGAGAATAACSSANGDTCSGTTTVAFAVLPNVGSISIVTTPVAAGAELNAAQVPTSSGTDLAKSVTVPLGVTTVLDGRVSSPGWTASAAAPAAGFTLTGGTGTIAKDKAKFSVPAAPVAASSSLLTGALVGAQPPTFSNRTSTPTGDSNGSAALLTAGAGGINAATFIPVLTVDVTGATAGTYTGTVTQSVS